MSYDCSTDGIRIKGDDSYHVMKISNKDVWVLLRLRGSISYKAAKFASPDEARAFAHSMGLKLTRKEEMIIQTNAMVVDMDFLDDPRFRNKNPSQLEIQN